MRSLSSYATADCFCTAIWQPQRFLCLSRAVLVMRTRPLVARNVLTCRFAMGYTQPHNCRIWRTFHELHIPYRACPGLSVRPLQYNDFKCGFCRQYMRLHAPALKRWVCAIAAVRARGVHYCTGYVDHGVGLGHSLRHIEFL